jgi:hypothetical protein
MDARTRQMQQVDPGQGAQEMVSQQKRAQKDPSQCAQVDPAQIEELIKANNMAALIKTDQAIWEACLIKTGPSSYVMDEYGLPKQSGVKQPDWVYKRRQFLKSLSVADRNFILTGDPAFSFDPVSYTTVYNFSYTDAIRGHTHRVIPPAQAPAPQVQAPQVPTPAPAQTPAPQAQAPQVPTPAPAQPPAPQVQASQVPTPAPAPQVQPPQVPTPTPAQPPVQVQTPQVQEVQQPAVISEPLKPTVVQAQTEPDITDLPPLEDDSNPTSPTPQPVQNQPQVPERLKNLLARTQLHNRVVTGSFSSTKFEAVEKFQAAIRAKEQLAALLAKNLQLEESRKQAEAYRERLASSSSSDSSGSNTPAGSPDSTPISKIKRNLDQVTNALNFSFARDSRLTRSTFKKKEGTGWPPKSSTKHSSHHTWIDFFNQLQICHLSTNAEQTRFLIIRTPSVISESRILRSHCTISSRSHSNSTGRNHQLTCPDVRRTRKIPKGPTQDSKPCIQQQRSLGQISQYHKQHLLHH